MIILTGDRPTGRLHLGHYVGSLISRLDYQNSKDCELFIMIADLQALTDNSHNPQKIITSVHDVTLDYLSVGIDPNKTNICIQSQIPAIYELPMFFSNLVTISRLERNPTLKSEIKQKNFNESVPVGFFTYPISQAADILAFNSPIIPVGEDQLPVIEQTREIARSFNRTYNTALFVEPKGIVPKNEKSRRLIGIDGNSKMSKSLNNGIYLSDTKEKVTKKVMSMYTDPNHINISDPGKIEGNVVFYYLDVFSNDSHFDKYLPDYKNLDELKKHYQNGGLGDVKIKRFLINILEELLEPIREKRKYYEANPQIVKEILEKGTKEAVEISNQILVKAKKIIGLNYFN
ncbi:MAG: tryptophan--tRNA ligase [Bacilli bacterium]